MTDSTWDDIRPRFERMFLKCGHRYVASVVGMNWRTAYRIVNGDHKTSPHPMMVRQIERAVSEWEEGGCRVPTGGRADRSRVLANANGGEQA